MTKYDKGREFMKSRFDKDYISDQDKELPQPSLVKEYDEDDFIIKLPKANDNFLKERDYNKLIEKRRSNRKYKNSILRIEELSYLLWSTQGVHGHRGSDKATFRPVPSGGARHAFETYLGIYNVEGLRKGMYRYLPLSHELLFLYEDEDINNNLNIGSLNQKFVLDTSITFIWSCIPYRGEWRYVDLSHKIMLIDVGYICQNLYLSAEALELGTCAIGAYHQEYMDKLIRVDGKDEYVVYMAPVGRKR